MKHVLALYSHNFSADYLSEQRLVGSTGMGPNLDSKDAFLAGKGKAGLPELRSVDGIQFHQFRHNAPCRDAAQPITKENVEYWCKLHAALPHGETLDVVVFRLAMRWRMQPICGESVK
ncbi:MAG: hypothetical protein ACOYNL_09125 [Rickettsiales bacterium]